MLTLHVFGSNSISVTVICSACGPGTFSTGSANDVCMGTWRRWRSLVLKSSIRCEAVLTGHEFFWTSPIIFTRANCSVPGWNVLPQLGHHGAHILPVGIELAGQLDLTHAVHLQRWLHRFGRRAVRRYANKNK